MFTACGGDEDKEIVDPEPVNKTEMLLIGEWNRDADKIYHLVFLENGTGYDKVMYGSNNYNIDETFNWSVSGSVLTIIWESSEEERFTVVTVNATDLILRNEDSFTTYTRVR